jgi:cytochrome c556
MIGLHDAARRRRRIAIAIRRQVLAVGFLGVSSLAWGQDQSAAMPKDAIFARKIIMDTIGANMDEIETMTNSSNAINLTEGHEHADTVSVMLMAFPHLFPPSTNQWKPNAERDPGRDTFASPEVWTKFADFYQQAATASKLAYNASRAKQESDFRKSIVALRNVCDSCHAVYLKIDQ